MNLVRSCHRTVLCYDATHRSGYRLPATGYFLSREASMIEQADAVIIGAGAFGASIAFHLARRGTARVALIDKFAVVSQTSPRAAGLTGQVRSTDAMTRLAMHAVRKIERFTEETGEPLVYHQVCSLKIARTLEHEAQLHREV